MKKVLSIILAIMMSAMLAACREQEEKEVKKPNSVETIGKNGESVDTGMPGKGSVDVVNETQDVFISETVLVDEAGVKITAKALSMDEIFGPELDLLIENNSGKNLTFQSRNVSINGYMIDGMMSVDVVNGKKANDNMSFAKEDLESCGIKSIADIDLSFHIFESDKWKTYLDTESISLKTSIADSYVYSFDDSGDVAYDENGIRIIIKGLNEDSFMGKELLVYIENGSAEGITVQTRDVSINGFMVTPIMSCDVVSGKRAVDTITFMDSELQQNNITEINDIELSFHVYNFDKWETVVDTDAVKITF